MHKLPILTLIWALTVGALTYHPCWGKMQAEANRADSSTPGRATPDPGSKDVTSLPQKTTASAPAPLDPRALLETAVRTLESRDAIAAQIRHEVDLFNKRLAGFGSYLEQRRGRAHLIRLELRIQLGDHTSSLLQICDGRFLWTYRKLQGSAKLGRVDVARANRALDKVGKTSDGGSSGRMEGLPSLGGLPRLLRGLNDSFDFTLAEPGRWGKQGRPVWKLHGQWKTEQLAKILPDQEAAIRRGSAADLSKLPSHLPDHVILLLGQEDHFPYRIEYRRSDDRQSRALVTMELFDVYYPGSIDPRRFTYNPGDLEYSDQTESYLESLGVKEAK